ncbi:MAG: AI-2E family transporter [Anaerolineae bacterium]
MTRRWSSVTKFWVLTAGAVLAAATVYRLRSLVPLVGLALIVTYIISPVVDRIERNSRLGRTTGTALVYLGLLTVLVVAPAILAPSVLEEARAIDRSLVQDIITNIINRIQAYSQDSVIAVFGFTFDLAPVYDQLIQNLEGISTSVAYGSINFFLTFASGFASTLLGLFLTLVLSFYLVRDSHMLIRYLENLVPPPYRGEVAALVDGINQVWRDFFRGQIILCAVVGFVTWLGLFILGVPNALLLGILAGVLELIPNLGPSLAAVPAVLIAYFQGSTHLGVSSGWFTLLVLLLYVGIQQIENTVLVPRIIGGSVHLHPVVVLVGVLAGASIAGILGIFLAAPVMASIRVIGGYVYEKLLDQPELPAEDKDLMPGFALGQLAMEEQNGEPRTSEDGDAAAGQPSQLVQTDNPSESENS